jgi:hypothetical protein
MRLVHSAFNLVSPELAWPQVLEISPRAKALLLEDLRQLFSKRFRIGSIRYKHIGVL